MSTLLTTRSLHGRVLGWGVAMVALVWLGVAVLTWTDTQHELDELLDGHLAQTAALLIQQQRNVDEDVTARHEGTVLAEEIPLHRYSAKVAFQVFHEGLLVARSGQVGAEPMTSLSAGFETRVLTDGTRWRIFATRGHEDDIRVIVAEHTELREDILWAVLGSVFKPLFFALPALALAIWWAVRRGLKPLRSLGLAVSQRQAQSTQNISLDDAPLEVQSLVSALNQLFERINRLVDSERRFTADAAHEMRTPIAAIRAQVQVAMGAAEPQKTLALQKTLAGCDRATRLVDQLLMLARLEAAPVPSDAMVDLSALTRSVAGEVVQQAYERQQTLELHADAPAPVRGNDALLGVLVRNLLDNASRYSPTGATVHVDVAVQVDSIVLDVHDSGPGMTAEQISQLGQRFFRVLGSDQPGSGLGWSIVHRIVQVHGAQLSVKRSALLGGLHVQLQFPASVKPA